MTRDTRLDAVKTIAIFGVMIIHICGYNYPVASLNWLGSVFWRSLCGASVPLFLMCSGALFLEPERPLPLKKLYLKNMLRILIACFVWAMLYKVYSLQLNGTFSGQMLIQSLKEVLLFQHEFHLYYVQVILLVYALLPIMRVFVAKAQQRELVYALALWFVLGVLYPTVRDVWPLPLLGGVAGQWWLNMTYASVGYSLLGYYLKKYPLSKRVSVTLLVFGILLTFGGTLLGSLRMDTLYERFLEGMTVGIACLGAGIYACCTHIKTAPRFCVYLSKAAFSIYLSHMFCIYIVFGYLNWSIYSLPAMVSAPLLALAALVICTGVYSVLSHIPFVKKWLI